MRQAPGPTPEDTVQLEKLRAFAKPYLPVQVSEEVEFLGDRDDQDGEVWAITYEEPSTSGVTLMLLVMCRHPDWWWSWHLSGGETERWGAGDPETVTPSEERIGQILDAMARGSIVVTRRRLGGTSVTILGPDGKAVLEQNRGPGLGGILKGIGPGQETTVTYRHWRTGP